MSKQEPLRALTAIALSSMVSCSCAVSQHEPTVVSPPQPPTEAPINEGAGRGGYLTVKLHLENGEEFQCVVDTGSPGCLLPRSLERLLGKPLGTRTFHTLGGARETESIYATPKLYLGKIPLMTADTIGTWDNPLGVLGMNCLRNYCIQLDFQAGKVRFLDPERVDPAELGKSFPLISTRYAYIRHPSLFGQKPTALLLDTGFPFDGMVSSKLFKRAVREQASQPIPLLKEGVAAGTVRDIASFPRGVWDNANYSNLVVQSGRPDLLGLKFLARHIVTFNFPKRVVYLK